VPPPPRDAPPPPPELLLALLLLLLPRAPLPLAPPPCALREPERDEGSVRPGIMMEWTELGRDWGEKW
jgi:hypothetical protein